MSKYTDYNEDVALRELVRRSEQESETLYDEEELYDDIDDEDAEEVSEGSLEEDDEVEYVEDERELYEDEDDPEISTTSAEEDSRLSWQQLRKRFSLDNRLFAVYCVLLISLGSYWTTYYKQRIRQITEQEKVLKELRYFRLYTTAELVRLERITNIEQSLKEMQLDLEFPTQPPYEVVDTFDVTKKD